MQNSRQTLLKEQPADEHFGTQHLQRHSTTGLKMKQGIIHAHPHHVRHHSGGIPHQYAFGPPVTLPQLGQPASSRNNHELGGAKTQQTPKHGASKEHSNSPTRTKGGVIGPFVTIPGVARKGVIQSAIGDPRTPQKRTRGETQGIVKHQHAAVVQKSKTVQRKSTKGTKTGSTNFNQAPVTYKTNPTAVLFQSKVEPMVIREQNLQSSEKKMGKYDRMLQSLEAVATKKRKTTPGYGSANKKTVTSTEATDPLEAFKMSLDTDKVRQQHDTRFGALSISSGISKNTGSGTMIGREKLAQLQQQQHHHHMIYHKQSIFDRNRPWNCEYCAPKSASRPFVDSKLVRFSRQCVSNMVSRFMIKEEFYESRKVVELLNTNSRSVLVANFKDFLIYDDIYEFLTSVYDLDTSLDILTRHAVFYDSLAQLEVLCQYREDQIRDRHLVLHGLKPCYVGLEKQIQGILASNFRNKLRLVINQVRKVQIARGLQMENTLSQDTSSQQSTPAAKTNKLTATQRAEKIRVKKDFEKLIQSSMVQEYNFSRSQSGLLIATDTIADECPNKLPFDTSGSINFADISFDAEVELLKGSVFENSIAIERPSEFGTEVVVENIESMYMNAQMILDDLSSRPLTRQSMPQENIATPASRLRMYELHKQEEHKIRLPFCLAPEKPFDQKTCSDGNLNTGSLLVSRDEIMIINDGERQAASSASPYKNQQVIGVSGTKHRITNLYTDDSIKPFVVRHDKSLDQPEHSMLSKDIQPAEVVINDTVVQIAQERLIPNSRAAMAASVATVNNQKRQLLPPTNDSNSNNSQRIRAIKTKNSEQSNPDNLSGNMRVENNPPQTATKLKSKKLSETPCSDGKRANNRNVHHPTPVKATVQGKGRGTPIGKQPSLVKASPGAKHYSQFTLGQHKAMAASTRNLPTYQGRGGFTAKKASAPTGFSNNFTVSVHEDLAAEGSQLSSQRMQEQSEKDKIKVSKKLIAQIKNHMVLSPNKAHRHPSIDRDDLQSASLPSARQLPSKGCTTAKNVKQRRAHGSQTKLTKSSTKRTEERNKASSSRKHVPDEKPSTTTLQISMEQKRPKQAKKHLSLKEQVILEALRKDSQGQTLQRTASGHQYLTQSAHHAQINDPQAIKLLRSQQMTATGGILTQSKSVVAQKVDLISIAGKLKLLGQPGATKGGTLVPSQVQRLQGASNRKSSIKLHSRKASIEQLKEDAHYSRNTSSSKQQMRFMSADGHAPAEENSNLRLHQSSKVVKEKVNKQGTFKRKLIPATQPIDHAYYTQRSYHQPHRSVGGAIQASPTTYTLSPHQFTPVQVHSRNATGAGIGEGGSLDQRHASQLSLVTKTQKNAIVGNTQPRKKISKLNRAVTGSVLSPKGGLGGDDLATLALSPRKLRKESDGKTRNNLAKGGQTQSQQRIVTFHQGGHHSLKQQTLTSSKQHLHGHHQTYQQQLQASATAATALSPSSRNAGLALTNTAASKHAVTTALNGLTSPKGGPGGKHMTSQQILQVGSPALSTQFVTASQVPITTTLKQELKLHSRKSSAIYTLSQGQKLQTISSSQTLVGAGAGCSNTAAHKKTKKKQQ